MVQNVVIHSYVRTMICSCNTATLEASLALCRLPGAIQGAGNEVLHDPGLDYSQDHLSLIVSTNPMKSDKVIVLSVSTMKQ